MTHSYATLHRRDFFGRLLSTGRYFGKEVRSDVAPLVQSAENFYDRRMYHRIQDVFNRPITGPPGANGMKILERKSTDSNFSFKQTGYVTSFFFFRCFLQRTKMVPCFLVFLLLLAFQPLFFNVNSNEIRAIPFFSFFFPPGPFWNRFFCFVLEPLFSFQSVYFQENRRVWSVFGDLCIFFSFFFFFSFLFFS